MPTKMWISFFGGIDLSTTALVLFSKNGFKIWWRDFI